MTYTIAAVTSHGIPKLSGPGTAYHLCQRELGKFFPARRRRPSRDDAQTFTTSGAAREWRSLDVKIFILMGVQLFILMGYPTLWRGIVARHCGAVFAKPAIREISMYSNAFTLNRNAFIAPYQLAKGDLREAAVGDAFSVQKRATVAVLQVAEPLPARMVAVIREIFDVDRPISGTIGTHPDFAFIQQGTGELHHCTTMFIDIKNSTHLGVALPLQDAYFLKNAVLRLAIGVVQALGGHIHRLQGDGLFAQFVTRGGYAQHSALAALDAASTFLFLVSNHLNPDIIQPALDPIAVRVGIDFGDDEEILWARYGKFACEEFTTTGLHVDLAAKLQADAPSNGVMVGHNVVKVLRLQEDYLSLRRRKVDGLSVEDSEFRMQPKGHDFRYKKWVFDWKKWTQHLHWLGEDKRCHITATYGDCREGPFPFPVDPRGSVPKGKWIQFVARGVPQYADKRYWTVVNQGTEAVAASQRQNFDDGLTMVRSTVYTGLHFAFFRGLADDREVARACFSVRVTDV